MRLKQLRPQPYAVERADTLPALGRFLDATPDAEIVWLSDGIDLGGGSDFVAALGRLVGKRQITVIKGGLAPAHALSSPDNSAGALTVKVLRSAGGTADSSVAGPTRSRKLPSTNPYSFTAWPTVPDVSAASSSSQRKPHG